MGFQIRRKPSPTYPLARSNLDFPYEGRTRERRSTVLIKTAEFVVNQTKIQPGFCSPPPM
jgi:hypothetical protein